MISYKRHMSVLRTNDGKNYEENVIFGGNFTQEDFTQKGWSGRQCDEISGFTQIDSRNILIVDKRHHCIRLLDRKEDQLRSNPTNVAGICEKEGYKNGYGNTSLFYYPHSISNWTQTIDGHDRYLITDSGNNAIRLYTHRASNDVATLISFNDTEYPCGISFNLRNPREMAFNSTKSHLFVTFNNGIARINTKSWLIEKIIKSDCQYRPDSLTRIPLSNTFFFTNRGNDCSDTERHMLYRFDGTHLTPKEVMCGSKNNDGVCKSLRTLTAIHFYTRFYTRKEVSAKTADYLVVFGGADNKSSIIRSIEVSYYGEL